MTARLLSLLLVLGLAAPLSAQPYFDAPFRTFSTGTYQDGQFPVALTAGDLDGDGRPDAIVGQNIGDGGIKILFNEGTDSGPPATFSEPIFYPTSEGAWDVIAADLDGDGDLDLAATNTDFNYSGTTVAILKNNGDGTFGAAQQYAAGGPSTGLTAADLDGDGDLDLAVANYGFFGSGSTTSVLKNDGTGAFPTRATYAVGNDPYRVEAGDLDGDGDLDLAVARSENDLSVLFNDGTGTFGGAVQYNSLYPVANTAITADVAVLDADQDGDLDLAYTGNTLFGDNGALAVLLRNDGSGGFSSELVFYNNNTDNPVIDLVSADISGDGYPDLVGAQQFGFGYVVLENDGAGGFLPAETYASINRGGETAEVAAVAPADLDGDGDLDVMTVGRVRRLLSAHENLGDGAFPRRPIYGDAFIHNALDVGDVDNDGDLDVVTSTESNTSTVNVLLNDGHGAFATTYETPNNIYGYAKLRDLDGNGNLDLLFVAALPPYDFFTARGNGDGTFQSVVRWPVGGCGFGHPQAFDIDGDGDLDVLLPEYLACTGVPSSARRIFASLNNGDGTFQPAYVIPETGSGPYNIAAADFNEDGRLDLVTAGRSVPAVLLGNGDGTFQTAITITGPSYRNVLALDLNADGHADIAHVEQYLPTGGTTGEYMVTILLGDGTGGFTETDYPQFLTQGVNVWISSGDIDGDGDPDLIAKGAQDVLVLLNDGAGAFTSGGRYGTARDGFAPRLADVTGDNRPDILVMASRDEYVGPLQGTHQGLAVIPGLTGTLPTAADPGRTPTTDLPSGYALSAVYPNPFNPQARFTLDLAQAQDVTVAVFDALGRRVATLQDGPLPSGASHVFTLDGTGLPSGVYVVRASGDTFTATRRAVLLR